MITSRQTTLLSKIEPGKNIPAGILVYIQTRAKNALHDFVMAKFFERERNAGLTKAELGRRIGRKPEVISRLLGAPGNWTIETVSDLLVGIAGEELEPASSSIAAKIVGSEPLP